MKWCCFKKVNNAFQMEIDGTNIMKIMSNLKDLVSKPISWWWAWDAGYVCIWVMSLVSKPKTDNLLFFFLLNGQDNCFFLFVACVSPQESRRENTDKEFIYFKIAMETSKVQISSPQIIKLKKLYINHTRK